MAIAYSEDMMQRLVSINFGPGLWFGVLAAARHRSPEPTAEVTFPGKAGGAPGIKLFTSGAGPGSFFASPHTATQSDMIHQFSTLGGAAVVGFGVSNPVAQGGLRIASEVLLKIDTFFRGSTFPVRVTFDIPFGAGDVSAATVYTIRKMKAGVVCDNTFIYPTFHTIADGGSSETQTSTDGSTVIMDFLINPTTGAVTI